MFPRSHSSGTSLRACELRLNLRRSGLIQVMVFLVVCFSLTLYLLMSSSGVTAPEFACHPGCNRTLGLLKRRFWWPTMEADTRAFINSCTVCTRSKASHRPLAGLPQPLPVPNCTWFHIALDFVTGLTPSQDKPTILTIIDRFSKAVHFIAFPKLPTAHETADLVTTYFFWLHSLPQDIVSDRGPQFVSQVWKTFCNTLGDTVSLSSGFHPQMNGQAEWANQGLEAALRCHHQQPLHLERSDSLD